MKYKEEMVFHFSWPEIFVRQKFKKQIKGESYNLGFAIVRCLEKVTQT